MRIDLVGQLCAGEVWASARPAARVAAKANAAHHVKTLRMLALRSLVLSNPSCRKPLADHLPPGGGRSARVSGSGAGDSASSRAASLSPHPGPHSAVPTAP